jgi:hypothetical protein
MSSTLIRSKAIVSDERGALQRAGGLLWHGNLRARKGREGAKVAHRRPGIDSRGGGSGGGLNARNRAWSTVAPDQPEAPAGPGVCCTTGGRESARGREGAEVATLRR